MADIPDYTGVLQQTLANNAKILSDNFSPQADLIRAQTQDQLIKNRTEGLQLQYMQQLADPDSDSSQQSSAPNVSDAGHAVDPTAMGQLQSRYAPLPATPYSPSELRTMQLAIMAGQPERAKLVQLQKSQTLDAVNQQRATAARQQYNDFYGVYSAPDGQATQVLSLVDPDSAARLQQAGAKDDDVRAWAGEIAGTLHAAARLPASFRETDGQIVNDVTKAPVPNAHANVGLGPKEVKELAKASTELVDTMVNGASAKEPRWKVEGADSAKDWIQSHIDAAVSLKSGGSASPLGGAPSIPSSSASRGGMPSTPAARLFAGGGAAGPAAQAPTQPMPGQGQQPAPGQAPQFAPGQSQQTPFQNPTRQPPHQTGYDFSEAPNKPAYLTIPNGRMPSDLEKAQQNDYVKAQSGLLQDANMSIDENQHRLVETSRMLSLLPNAKVGPGSDFLAKVQNSWAMLTGAQAADMIESNSTAWNILAKKLGQSALQEQLSKLKSEGASVRLGAQESSLILNTLSASPEMGKGAIDQLLRWEAMEADYSLHKAQAVRPYLASGKDATQFSSWYNGRYPQQANLPLTVSKSPTNASSGAQGSAPKAALDYLAQNPEVGPQFKAKYGYLPTQGRGATGSF